MEAIIHIKNSMASRHFILTI